MAAEKLDLLILKTLALTPQHGYGIGQRIEQMSGGVFRVTLGSLYPALQRLERDGLIDAEWRASDNNRRARYYRITAAGRRRLAAEQKDWERVSAAVSAHPEGDLTRHDMVKKLWRSMAGARGGGDRLDREAQDELAHHVELAAAEKVAGRPRPRRRRAARRGWSSATPRRRASGCARAGPGSGWSRS